MNLRLELDRKKLWRDQNHIWLHELSEEFARYPYLTRLKDETVLANSVRDGIAKTSWEVETFAYADAYDEATQTYLGLAAGGNGGTAQVDMVRGLLAKPEIAAAQFARTKVAVPDGSGTGEQASQSSPVAGNGAGASTTGGATTTAVRPRRFFLRVSVDDPTKLAREINKVGNDIVALLAAKGAKVDIEIEVKAELDAGMEESLQDRLRANAAAHNFAAPEFDA